MLTAIARARDVILLRVRLVRPVVINGEGFLEDVLERVHQPLADLRQVEFFQERLLAQRVAAILRAMPIAPAAVPVSAVVSVCHSLKLLNAFSMTGDQPGSWNPTCLLMPSDSARPGSISA